MPDLQMKANTLSISKLIVCLVLLVLLIGQWKSFSSFYSKPVTLDSRWLLLGIWVLLLAPFNWYLECLRLRSAMTTGKDHTITDFWKIVMSGFTLGFITPARLGDYAGRAVMVPNKSTEIVMATWVAGLCQNWFNVVAGMVGALYLFFHFHNPYLLPVILISGLLLSVISILLCYPHGRRVLFDSLVFFVKKYLKFLRVPEYLRVSNAGTVNPKLFLFSGLRYIIYLTQYLIIANAMGILAPGILLVSIISTILLIQSMLPLPFIAGLLSRAEISSLIWSLILVPFDKALTVSFIIWMINLMLPALIGLKYVLSLNPMREIH
ncbi:MAG: hypothetical protein ABIR66_04750 [Saprospiraceae bacterium]